MSTTNAACKVAAAPQPIVANDDDATTDRGKIEIKDAMKRSLELGEPVVIRTAISPETAGWLLGNNTDNRNQSETKYFQYADDMRSGRWMENGDGIAISKCNSLNNGQNRCRAVQISGVTIMTNVTVGLERSARETNDTGLPRTLSAILKMAGIINASIIGAMTRMLLGFEETGTMEKRPIRDNSPAKVRERVLSDHDIVLSAEYVRSIKCPKGLLSKAQVAFFHYVLMKHDPANAEAFLTPFVTGMEDGRGLSVNDPRHVTRMRIMTDVLEKKNPPHSERGELVFRAWNAWREGRTLTQCKVNKTLPKLV